MATGSRFAELSRQEIASLVEDKTYKVLTKFSKEKLNELGTNALFTFVSFYPNAREKVVNHAKLIGNYLAKTSRNLEAHRGISQNED